MEKFLDLAIAFAKDNGVGVAVPITVWLIAKNVIDDYKDKREAGVKNQVDIHDLQLQVARLEEKLKSVEKAMY
jgi:hypothetical protein